jgi:hypothetical protein
LYLCSNASTLQDEFALHNQHVFNMSLSSILSYFLF